MTGARLSDIETLSAAECARHWLEKLHNDKKGPHSGLAGIALRLVNAIVKATRERMTAADLAAHRGLITGPGGDA